MKHNIRLLLAYDGSSFFGWQKTDAGPSVEGTLQTVLEQILQEKVTLQAASRTDRGVHAEGQVVNFFTEKSPPSKRSLNQLLPPSIRLLDLHQVAPTFHPTLDAKGKLYTYALCLGEYQAPFHRHFSWHVPDLLKLEEMKRASLPLIGEHDFTSFCNFRENLTYPDKIRRVDRIDFIPLENNRLQIAIGGNHFLYKMVRNLVGTLVDVGRGRIEPERIFEILAAKHRPQAGVTAPAHGLTLKEIYFA